jgi:N-acyl-D-amino-acid deacylase
MIEKEGRRFDLWIRNGSLLDGRADVPQQADILIRDRLIRYIGPVDTSAFAASTTIEAKGRTVTPGFIDAHAHGDPLATPAFENFLAMGVTTICLGQDGSSPAETDLRNWMRRVADTIPGVNIALFAGHGTLRQLSGVGYKRDPGEAGLERMKALLRDAMKAGCFGMSTGLEYTPGTYAGERELLGLARVVGENDGLIMSHLRSEDDDEVEDALRELLRQGQYCNVHASHLKVVYGRGADRAEEILALLDSARQGTNFNVTADVYPYTASYTGIGIVFPDWAKPPHHYAAVRQQRHGELLGYLKERIMARNGPEATLFGSPPYAGKTLQEVAQEQNRPFEEVLLEIGPGGASGAYFVMDQALQNQLLQSPFVMVCSDGSPTMHHPRGYGSFAKIIEKYVTEEQLLSLPEAIRKMTSLPAETIGLQDRGMLEPGRAADILIFHPDSVQAHATFSLPHRQASGFEYVIVNGSVALQQGSLQEARSGRVLRKKGLED